MQRNRSFHCQRWSPRGTLVGFGMLCAVLAFAAPVPADTVVLKDGRKYEGKVISRNDEKVVIDTKVGRGRTTIGFPAGDVESVTESPLAPGFFDPPPAADRVSDAKKFKPGQPLYLVVPIVGELGKDYFAEGVAEVVRYAKHHKIQHIVFEVDAAGGDRDEAVELYDILKAAKEALKLHILVKQCIGPPLVVPVWASSFQILPGGKLAAPPPPEEKGDAEDEMSRAQLTYKVLSESGRKGINAEIVRAMLDPDSTLCIWRGADGSMAYDAVCPDDLSRESIILSVGTGGTLDLTYELGRALGMKDFNGGPADLGALLGLEGWAQESDYGAKTMARVTAARQKAAQARQATVDAKIAKNNSRRQTTENYISHCLQEAAKWDPTKGSYEKYSTHYEWGWGWGDYAQGKYTIESQKKWKNLTDATRYYISCAAKGLKEMKPLEAEAVKLGLEPIYKPGELDTMYQDLNVKYVLLGENRDKTGD